MEAFLKSIYSHGCGLVFKEEEIVILTSDQSFSYCISTQHSTQLQKKLSDLFPTLQWENAVVEKTLSSQIKPMEIKENPRKRKDLNILGHSMRLIGSTSEKVSRKNIKQIK